VVEFTLLCHPSLLLSWKVGSGGPDNAACFAPQPRWEVWWWSEVWERSFPAWTLPLVIDRDWLEGGSELLSREAPLLVVQPVSLLINVPLKDTYF